MVEAARLRRARARHESGRTLIEGPHTLDLAIAAGAGIRMMFALAEDEPSRQAAADRGFDVIVVTADVLEKVADTTSPRGPVAVIDIPPQDTLTHDVALVLCGVSDPGNLGTIIRTAAAFGFDVWAAGGADPWSPKVLRSAAGAHFQTGLRWNSELAVADLKSAGYRVVASVVDGGEPPAALKDRQNRQAVLIGSEAHGLSAAMTDAADAAVTIPMPGGVESLNVAVAASILMYAWRASG